MAGTITHGYFAMDLYDRLSIRSKELLIDQKEAFKLYAQNMDVLFFYNLASLRKGKNIRDFGYKFQKIKTYDFFSTLINYIKYNNHQYEPDVMAYLYGMLSHYVLDSTMHPYIIYKTGVYDKNDKSTYKYNFKHNEFETYFDNYLYTIREGANPHKFKCYNFCFNVDYCSDSLKEVMDFTFEQVHGISNFHKYYFKACKQMKSFYRIFRYDPTGIKRLGYSLVDLITPKSITRTTALSYHFNNKGWHSYLNVEHKLWYNPTDKRTKSTQSMTELYTEALGKATNMIQEINKYLYYDKKINLKKVIGNLNYVTGKDCEKSKELKYFEI